MDIQKILAELREQRDQVAAVIEALEKDRFPAKAPKGPATQMANSESHQRVAER